MDPKIRKNIIFSVFVALLGALILGSLAGALATWFLLPEFLSGGSALQNEKIQKGVILSQDERIVKIVEEASPAVVSIVSVRNLPTPNRQTQGFDLWNFFNLPQEFFAPQQHEQQGSGFLVSEDGLIVTNKHVVAEAEAEYTVILGSGEQLSAEVLARDPVHDLAILKIEKTGLPFLSFGDSDQARIGQTAIAIGNALGEFRNTVSVGVVSGLGRSLTAFQGVSSELLEGVIQTDAAINPGNSGGPLLNLNGEVIGINVAVATGAQNIAFSLPANAAKRSLEMVEQRGEIVYPFLGVRYLMIDRTVAENNDLSVESGAWLMPGSGQGEAAVLSGGPADKAGLLEGDIILEIDGVKLEGQNTLAKLIQQKNIGDTVTLKILRQNEEKTVQVVLEEKK